MASLMSERALFEERLLEEPLFEPEDIAGFEDSTQAALKHAPSALLRTLKGVSTTWRKRARYELCSRTCHVQGQPTPVRREEITCINAEYLIREDHPWEAVTAELQLPNLTRLCGYGFTVDMAMVRAADMDNAGGKEGQIKAVRACITPGQGKVPPKLLAVAIACTDKGGAYTYRYNTLQQRRAYKLYNIALASCWYRYTSARKLLDR